MSEVSYRNKGPAPQVHDNSKLQIRQGSPAHYQATTSSIKTEMRPQSTVHTMGAKSAALPPHLAGRQPAAVQPPKVLGGAAASRGAPQVLGGKPGVLNQPNRTPQPPQLPKPTPGSVGRPRPAVNRTPVTRAAAPQAQAQTRAQVIAPQAAPLESRLISPEGALLLGQICEMFVTSEQFSGRGATELVQLAVKTLTDMQPLFPPGVEIPIPNVSPPEAQAGPSVVMVPLPLPPPPVEVPAAPAASRRPRLRPPRSSRRADRGWPDGATESAAWGLLAAGAVTAGIAGILLWPRKARAERVPRTQPSQGASRSNGFPVSYPSGIPMADVSYTPQTWAPRVAQMIGSEPAFQRIDPAFAMEWLTIESGGQPDRHRLPGPDRPRRISARDWPGPDLQPRRLRADEDRAGRISRVRGRVRPPPRPSNSRRSISRRTRRSRAIRRPCTRSRSR